MIYDPLPLGKVCSICRRWFPINRLEKCKPCTYGVSQTCKECVNRKKREYYAVTRDAHSAYKKQWRLNNLEKERKRDRDRSAKHNEEARKRRAHNPAPTKRYQNTWRRNNPDKRRAYEHTYYSKHPGKIAEKRHRRKARLRELDATFTRFDWAFCLKYWNYRCAYCGRPVGLWHTLSQDHFIPLTKGGGYTPENIVPACHGADGCNNSKHDANAEEWLSERFGKHKANAILKGIQAYFDYIAEIV